MSFHDCCWAAVAKTLMLAKLNRAVPIEFVGMRLSCFLKQLFWSFDTKTIPLRRFFGKININSLN